MSKCSLWNALNMFLRMCLLKLQEIQTFCDIHYPVQVCKACLQRCSLSVQVLFICSFPILLFTILKAALAMKQGNVNLAAQKKSRALIFSKFYFSGDLRQINFLYARWSKIRIFLLRSTCGKKKC